MATEDWPHDVLEQEARAFIGIGGNLGDRLATLRAATRALADGAVATTRVVGASPVFETRPVGPSTEPFLNAALELRTRLPPMRLLAGLLELEARHGRERRKRWDARTLDLDLLVYQRAGEGGGWMAVEGERDGLRLPHPGARARDFVLVPLGELVGDEAVVGGRSPRAWVRGLGAGERTILRRLDEGLLDGSGG